jgi:hypothetical protein
MNEDDIDMAEEVSSAEKSFHKQSDKLCFICESNKAEFCIKDVPGDCYCKACAEEAFGDVDCLEKI